MEETKGMLPDWNQRYLDGDTPWDKGEPAPALIQMLEQESFPTDAEFLVPGCGYGHDVRAIVSAGYPATGLDISESAVAGAKWQHKDTAAMFEAGDFFDPLVAQKKRYSVLWEHTCFCAIMPEQRDAYVEAAYRWLKPGGVLVGVFFAFGDDEEGPPFKTTIETLHRHFKKRFILEWERQPEHFFPTREGQEWLMSWRRK